MTDLEEMYKLLNEALGTKENGLKVLLRPKLKIYIKKDFVERNKMKFAKGVKDLNNALREYNPGKTLDDGLSYISIAGCPNYYLGQRDVLMLIAVGKVLGFWDIFPDPEKLPQMFEMDAIGMFPMTTEMKV